MMERTLTFNYPGTCQMQTRQLMELLETKKIQYKVYNNGNDYPTTFVVRKSGYTWNELYKLVNSVKAARYRFL